MAAPKNIIRTAPASAQTPGRPAGTRNPPKVYVRNAPVMRESHAVGARRVEAAYAVSQLSAPKGGKCCARCTKRPYSDSCGNPVCPCHK